MGRFRNPLVVAVSMFTAVVATLAVNIAANVVSPANDFANAFPRLIGFRTGEDLYLASGAYRYRRGWNWRAVAAAAVGCALAWGGLVVPLLAPLYSYAWFVGFLAAALVPWSLMRLRHDSPEAGRDQEASPRTASGTASAMDSRPSPSASAPPSSISRET